MCGRSRDETVASVSKQSVSCVIWDIFTDRRLGRFSWRGRAVSRFRERVGVYFQWASFRPTQRQFHDLGPRGAGVRPQVRGNDSCLRQQRQTWVIVVYSQNGRKATNLLVEYPRQMRMERIGRVFLGVAYSPGTKRSRLDGV